MRIALKSDPSKEFLVYAAYWGGPYGGREITYSVINKDDGFYGFTPLGEEDVDLVDPDLDHYFFRKGYGGMTFIIHKAAFPTEEFFDALVDHADVAAVDELLRRVREMGIDPD